MLFEFLIVPCYMHLAVRTQALCPLRYADAKGLFQITISKFNQEHSIYHCYHSLLYTTVFPAFLALLAENHSFGRF